jgi:AbrB family looped-hinge helix DNA binding protein
MIISEVTSLSSKGQVVIPGRFRKEMGLKSGSKLMVISDGSNLLLKPMQPPKIEAFTRLIQESQRFARASGLKKGDISKSIKKVRRESRH